MMHITRAFRLWAISGALLLMGCTNSDYSVERVKKECGFPGNGCWSDSTCNTGSTCNVKRKGELLAAGVCPAEYGVCEQRSDASAVDGKVAIDGSKPSTEARADQLKPDQLKPDQLKPDQLRDVGQKDKTGSAQ